MRPILAILVLLLAFAALVPARAAAAPTVRFGIKDDAWLMGGPGTLEQRLTRLDQLGVQIVRFTLRWDAIARARPQNAATPDDPGYDWSSDDPVLRGLKAHGIDAVVGLLGTPSWANGGRGPFTLPTKGSDFADFATAAATRYSWVTKWLVWNEPNQRRWLQPTSPALYTTRLLNPAYAAIHAATSGALVGGGVTAPRGSTGGVSPVDWIAGMRRAHARLDAYAHNPYPLDPRRETPSHGGCARCRTITLATIDRLVSLVAQDFGRARIWLTEYGYQTNPPDRALGVSPALQARYQSEAAYRAYATPRVDMLIHFLYQDEPEIGRFQSGLVTRTGVPKPALAAFQLPLAEIGRSGSVTRLWGQVRTGAATYELQVLGAGTWQTLAPPHAAGPDGIVAWRGTLGRGAIVRLVAGGLTGAPLTIA